MPYPTKNHLSTLKNLGIVLFAYTGIYILGVFAPGNAILLPFLQCIGGIFLLFLSGIFPTMLLQKIYQKSFQHWEFLSISFLSSILFFPLLLQIEFLLLGHTYNWLPLANIIAIYIITFLVAIHTKNPAITIPNFTWNIHYLWKPPFTICFASMFLLVGLCSISFQALPDLDPYSWLFKYSHQFAYQQLDTINERPFFGDILFIGTQLTGLDIFIFLKYVFPFFLVAITIPAWMIAQTFSSIKHQWLFLAMLFTSPVILLYGQTQMPQAFFIILSYYFTFFLLYHFIKQDNFFLYAAGVLMILGFFYHPAAAIPLLVYIFGILITKRKYFLAHKKISALILLLLLSNAHFLEPILRFILSWTKIFIHSIFQPNNINLIYPATYTNIDTNQMGWTGLSGVIQFYGFHMGPILGILLLLFLVLFTTNRLFRQFTIHIIRSSPGIFIGFAIFCLFFAIAEIFPRFPNIALLPDRAWIFSGIFAFVLAFILLRFFRNIPQWIIWLTSILLIIGISGTLYINTLKRYLITPAQWRSAEWIKENLPQERIFLSAGHKNLLPVHANSRMIKLPAEAYCGSGTSFQETINRLKIQENPADILHQSYPKLNQKIQLLISDAEIELKNGEIDNPKQSLKSLTADIQKELTSLQTTLDKIYGLPLLSPPTSKKQKSKPLVRYEDVYRSKETHYTLNLKQDIIYIYYSKIHEKNPYRLRPYTMTTWGIEPCPSGTFFFDQHPQEFQQIYNDNEEIIIWKML